MAKSGRSLCPADLNRELVTRITTDMTSREGNRHGATHIRAADRFVVGLILVFQACAAVAVLLMLRRPVRLFLAPDHALSQITSQAARFLPYWALLLYVHAIALAWFRGRLRRVLPSAASPAPFTWAAATSSPWSWPRPAMCMAGPSISGLLGDRRGAQPDLGQLPGRLFVALAGAGPAPCRRKVASGEETRVGSHVGRIRNPSYEQRIGNPSYEQRIGNPSSNEADLRNGYQSVLRESPTPISHNVCRTVAAGRRDPALGHRGFGRS